MSSNNNRHRTLLRAYGVEAIIEADDRNIFEKVKAVASKALVGRLTFGEVGESAERPVYSFLTNDSGTVEFNIADVTSGEYKDDFGFERFLNGAIRSHIAAMSKSWVFLHAGVVEWRGKAIILPGHSHKGKTTLVSELIRLGAGYMSDEYAVMDENGLVHPFERDLGVRFAPDEGPTPVDPAVFGGARAIDPVEAGMIVFTGFVKNAEWKPETITLGSGILESVPEVIPFSFNTEFVLKVLNTTFNRAIIVKSDRGEALDTAPKILEYFDQLIIDVR
ncbi:MAG: hypothetical protein PSX80_08680 [bacterium]|nr:hypothetical protein [bacterium]